MGNRVVVPLFQTRCLVNVKTFSVTIDNDTCMSSLCTNVCAVSMVNEAELDY